MAARRPPKIRPTERAASTNLPDATVSRAVDEARAGAQAALDRPSVLAPITVNLVIGTNVVQHGLGRAPGYVGVTPTVADATFAWALKTDNPHPDRQVLIVVVGVAQPGARVFLS